jgi:hypothetical protein
MRDVVATVIAGGTGRVGGWGTTWRRVPNHNQPTRRAVSDNKRLVISLPTNPTSDY